MARSSSKETYSKEARPNKGRSWTEDHFVSVSLVAMIVSFACGAAIWVATISYYTNDNTQKLTALESGQEELRAQFTRSVQGIEKEVVRIRAILDIMKAGGSIDGSEEPGETEGSVSGLEAEIDAARTGYADPSRDADPGYVRPANL